MLKLKRPAQTPHRRPWRPGRALFLLSLSLMALSCCGIEPARDPGRHERCSAAGRVCPDQFDSRSGDYDEVNVMVWCIEEWYVCLGDCGEPWSACVAACPRDESIQVLGEAGADKSCMESCSEEWGNHTDEQCRARWGTDGHVMTQEDMIDKPGLSTTSEGFAGPRQAIQGEAEETVQIERSAPPTTVRGSDTSSRRTEPATRRGSTRRGEGAKKVHRPDKRSGTGKPGRSKKHRK